jgi:RNA polymerase sigma-70 factor (ECF subfamily)
MKTFTAIYNQFHSVIFKTINRQIKDTLVAEELTNDVFLKVHKKLDTYDESKASLSTWIHTIAKNILIDYWRKPTVKVTSFEVLPSANDSWEDRTEGSWFKSDSLNPEQQMVFEESENSILTKFHTLPAKEREIADLYYMKGHSYQEIADTLSLPMGTVKAKLFSARTAMQQAAGLLN